MKTPLVREKLTLRLPPVLHQSLRAVAVDNGRSLNAEIVQRLRRSFDGGGAPDDALAVLLDPRRAASRLSQAGAEPVADLAPLIPRAQTAASDLLTSFHDSVQRRLDRDRSGKGHCRQVGADRSEEGSARSSR